MKNGALCYRGVIQQLWMVFMAAVFMADANALVLGDDIQVDSALGRPLNARIAIVELTEAEAQQFKVRLADTQDYKKLGLIYPDNHKFRFRLVNESGKQPYIQVTSRRPVVDPFVDLLIETTSVAGKLERSYTVLLDPAPDAPVDSNEDARQAHAPMEVAPPAAVKSDAVMREPVKVLTSHKRHHHQAMAVRTLQDEHRQMRLSMSLSISRYDPSMSASTNSDALQEELIAKEKLLNDLKLQIGEMQLVIKDLKEKQAGRTAVDMAASGVVAASAVSASGVVAVSRVIAASAVPVILRSEANRTKAVPAPQFLGKWKKPVVTLASLLAVVSCLFWFRGRMDRSMPGPFDDLHADEADMSFATVSDNAAVMHGEESAPPLSLKQPAPLKFDKAAQSVASSEQKGQSIVPPEYAVLMEANKHLRAGNEELAEGALLRAIGINPGNAYGYLALLKLYEKRADKSSFEKIAKQLQMAGDAASFKEAAVMGGKLDPDNPLYATGKMG